MSLGLHSSPPQCPQYSQRQEICSDSKFVDRDDRHGQETYPTQEDISCAQGGEE